MLGSERIDAVQRLTIDLKDSRNAIIAASCPIQSSKSGCRRGSA